MLYIYSQQENAEVCTRALCPNVKQMEEKAEPLSSPLASAFVTADICLRAERVEGNCQG